MLCRYFQIVIPVYASNIVVSSDDRRNGLMAINGSTRAKEAYCLDFRQFHANRIPD